MFRTRLLWQIHIKTTSCEDKNYGNLIHYSNFLVKLSDRFA